MDVHSQMVQRIIKAQESIVGPIALEQAKKVSGLKIGDLEKDIKIDGDKKDVLERLIKQYQGIFGTASVEVCKGAVRGIISSVPKDQLPPLLVS